MGFEKRGGGLKISKLGGALFLFKFENKCEANLVLLRGNKWFKEREFQLQRWGPEVGCFWNGSHAKEVWVRIVGLPLHFWSREVFKRIGESCGGFIAVDEETTLFSLLQWARILVRAIGKDLPRSLRVVADHTCFMVRLWLETPPWVSQVVPQSEFCKSAGCEVRGEGVGGSHVGESVWETQLVV